MGVDQAGMNIGMIDQLLHGADVVADRSQNCGAERAGYRACPDRTSGILDCFLHRLFVKAKVMAVLETGPQVAKAVQDSI